MIGKRQLAVAFACLMAWPDVRTPAQAVGKETTPVSITQKDFAKVIKVKAGDVIEIRLPMDQPLTWVLQDNQPLLTTVSGYPTSISVPRDPNSPVPELGAGAIWINRYTVAADRTVVVPLAWVYCRKGELALTKERLEKKIIPTPPDFRPDLKHTDLREGMVFKVKLDAQP
jgi:hypothetical protein